MFYIYPICNTFALFHILCVPYVPYMLRLPFLTNVCYNCLDDGFTPWTQWSACFSTSSTSTNCGRTRRRNCQNPLEGCKGNRNETQECSTQQCPVGMSIF